MFILVCLGLLGLMVGSFINAAVWRLYQQSQRHEHKSTKKDKAGIVNDYDRRISITKGRSMCPNCKHQLAALDLIPVVSWVMLAGKCRYCHKSISAQYPLVELLTGSLFALSGYFLILNYSPSAVQIVNMAFWLYFLTVLIILALYDLRWYILPDLVLIPAIVAGLARLLVLLAMGEPVLAVINPLLAALAVGTAFYALAAVSNGRWMGGGDIKLVFLMGLILSWAKLGVALLLAFNFGALIGVILIALKLKHRRDHIPFGPFLVGGTIVAVLYGQVIISWYVHTLA